MKGGFKILAPSYQCTLSSWKEHSGFSLASGAHEAIHVLSNTNYWQFHSVREVDFLPDML